MNRNVLIVIGIVCAVVTAWAIVSYDYQTGRLKAKREAELKHLIVQIQSDDPGPAYYDGGDMSPAGHAVWGISELNAVELIPELMQLLKHKSPRTRGYAVKALGELLAKEAIPEIIKLLKEDDYFVLRATIEALGQLRAREAIPELIAILNSDKIEHIGTEAIAIALGKMDANESIPALLKLMNSNDHKYGSDEIVFILARMDVKEAISELKENMITYYPGLRFASPGFVLDESKHKLFREKVSREELIPRLMEILKKNPRGQGDAGYMAVDDLSKLKAIEVIPEIISLLNDNSEFVRQLAVCLLGELNAKEFIPKLLGLLRDDNSEKVRRATIFALGRLGAKEAIPELMGLIKDDEKWELFRGASDMLADLGVKEAIPELKNKMKNHKYESCRPDAAFALVKLGVKEAIPELIELTKQDDGCIEVYYIPILAERGIKESMPELKRLLVYDSKWRRVIVAVALVKLGERNIPENIIQDMQSVLNEPFYYEGSDITEQIKETLIILGKPVEYKLNR